MGSRHIRIGVFSLACGLGLMAVAAALPSETLIGIAALVAPLALVLAGLRELARGLRARMDGRLADTIARALRAKLTDEYLVIPHYAPRDSGDGEVALVVVGPPGVVVIEPRADEGDVVCYQDHWFRADGSGRTHSLADSPSRRARWNATRVRSDVATGGFVRTPVDAVVLFTRGRLADSSSSCVPALAGTDELVSYLVHGAPRVAASRQRTRALAEVLAGRLRVASA